MAEKINKYTHVGVLERTQKQISILASIANGGQGVRMYNLVDNWTQTAWAEAREAGLVTDAMLAQIEQAIPSRPEEVHWVKAPSTPVETPKRRRKHTGRDF